MLNTILFDHDLINWENYMEYETPTGNKPLKWVGDEHLYIFLNFLDLNMFETLEIGICLDQKPG